MFLKTKTIDRNLHTVPFERAFQIYTDAYNNSIQNQEHYYQQQQADRVAYIEQLRATNDTSEGGMSETPVEVSIRKASTDSAKKSAMKAVQEEFLVSGLIAENMQQYYMPQILKLLAQRWNTDCISSNPDLGCDFIDGKIARQILFKDFKSDWDKGLWLFLMLDSRSSWLKTQYKAEGRAYCALVPLILYAIKNAHGIKYSQWCNIEAVVNNKLAQAMLFEFPEGNEWIGSSNEEKISWRNKGLTYKTGPKVNQLRAPESTYKLWSTTDTPMLGVPELAQVMYTQIWCAHPQNRTRHMVLDPQNWDIMPAPLVETNLFTSSKVEVEHDLPW